MALTSPARNLSPSAVLAMVLAVVSASFLLTPWPILSLFPAGAVLFFMAMSRRPELVFYAFVFLVPFGAFRQIGPVRLHWLFAGSLLLYVFLHQLKHKEVPPAFRSGLWLLVLPFLALNVLATLFSPYPDTATKHLILLVFGYVFVGLGIHFIDRQGLVRVLPATVVASNTLSSVMALMGYFWSISLFAEKVHQGGFKRGLGAAPDPNNMALMIIFAMPFLASWFFETREGFKKMLVAGLVLVNVMGLVTTYSRGGTLILSLTLLLILWEHRRRFKLRQIGLLMISAVMSGAIVLALVPASFWARQASLAVGKEDFSIGRRTSYIIVAWDSFLKRPLIGFGPDTFQDIYEGSAIAQRFKKRNASLRRHAHNTYLEILVGSGILSLGLFLAILMRQMKHLNRARDMLDRAGDALAASRVATLRTAYMSLLLYMLIFSDIYHKYLLLSLAGAEAALFCARHVSEKTERPDAA